MSAEIQRDPVNRQVLGASRLDLLLAVVLAAVTVYCVSYFAPRGFNSGFVDMAHDGYQLRQALDLANGGVIFRDTFDQYGPLTSYLNLIGFNGFGERLLAIKYFLAFWYGLTALVMLILARQFLGTALSVVTVVLWLMTAPFFQHGVMISPHAYALLFQAIALILLLRGYRRPRLTATLFVIGVLCGVCWLLKQSLGSLFYLAIVGFVLTMAWLEGVRWRTNLLRVGVLAAGMAAVILPALGWLAWQGALDDWYRQTVVFPRTFYLTTVDARGWSLPLMVRDFVLAQMSAESLWLWLRAIVFAGAVVEMVRRGPKDIRLVLAAWVTGFLWLAAFPSANYMHQWWTMSPTIAAALFVLHRGFGRLSTIPRLPLSGFAPELATVGVLLVLAWVPIEARLNDAAARDLSLSAVITEPPSLQGIHSDPVTHDALAAMYRIATAYREQHPGAAIISIDASDGYRTGVAHSLPLLSFFRDNVHPHPVYWSLPALSTSVYPGYASEVSEFIQEHRPLIVDFRKTPEAWSRDVAGYRLASSAMLPAGRLSIYEPSVPAPDPPTAVLEWTAGEPAIVVSPNPIPEERPGADFATALAALKLPADLQERIKSRQVLSEVYVDVPTSHRLIGTVQKYQLSWAEVSEGARQTVIAETTRQLLDEYMILRASGVSNARLVDVMAANFNSLVAQALTLGTALPEEAAPMLDALLAAHRLKRPDGQPIADREDLRRLLDEARVRPPAAPRSVVDLRSQLRRRVSVSGWPDADWLPERIPAVEPLRENAVTSRAGIVSFTDGEWLIRGTVDGPMSYLVQFAPTMQKKAAHVVATGQLVEGGLTIGLQRNQAWVGWVNIEVPGWFVSTLTVPEDGEYEIVVANNVPSNGSAWRRLLAGVGLGRLFPALNARNDFRLQSIGWVAPAPAAAQPQ